MTTKDSKITSNKLLTTAIGAIVTSIFLTGILVAAYPVISSAVYAVQPNNTAINNVTVSEYEQLQKIAGSINVIQVTKNVIKDNLKVSFSQAADIAGKQITNGTVIGGHLGVVQGYLAYTFFGMNPGTNTTYFTVIDAGNGKVLYTSPVQQMRGGGFFEPSRSMGGLLGQFTPHGFAAGFGHGSFGFGPWNTLGCFMGGAGIWR